MESSNDILMHYGTLGMKWRKRRYQYEDGSLTPEGRRHYGVGAPREGLAGRIDEYRRKRLQAKVERETQKRVAAQQKLKAAEAETDTKLQNDRLKNKSLVEEETAKRQAAEEQLAAAKAIAKAEKAKATAAESEANAAATKRNAKIDAIKDTVRRITGNSPEDIEARAQKKLAKIQLQQAKAEQKLKNARVKEEIRKLKEQRKAEKEKKNEPPSTKDGDSAAQYSSYESLYANRRALTDSEFKAAKARLDEEQKIYDIIAKNQKADRDAKIETAKAIGGMTMKVLGAVWDASVKHPEVGAAAVGIGYTAIKNVTGNKPTKKLDEAFNSIQAILRMSAAYAQAAKSNK